IVRDALMGKRRFGEFQQSLGAARNILAARLRKLVACGILEQVVAGAGAGAGRGAGAPREYALTESGRALRLGLAARRPWGAERRFPPPEREVLVERTSGERVALELRTHAGRRVRPADLALAPKLSQRVKAPSAKA